MFTSQKIKFSTLGAILLLLLNLNHYCFCLISNINDSFVANNGFSQAVGTWYGNPNGPGSTGGACGFGADVARPPFNSFISSGSPILYKSGKGCGSCYQVRCTQHPACSGKPVTVTITDECPGCSGVHFDLSGVAFGALAKRGQDYSLRNAGKITVQYQSVPCRYNKIGITFKIDLGSNPYYLAFTIEYVGGDGDVGYAEISSPSTRGWLAMQESSGATWKVNLPGGSRGPFSVRVTTLESKRKIVATNVIPANWRPGQRYHAWNN